MSRNDVTVQIDGCFENLAAILLSWMLGDSHFSFRRSLPFPIFSILTKKKKKKSVREKLQIFRLFCSRAIEDFFECGWARLIRILFQGLFYLKVPHQLKNLLNRLSCVKLSTFI